MAASFEIGHGVENRSLRKVKEGGDKANPRRVTTWEGEVVDGNDSIVLFMVGIKRTRSSNEEFNERDEDEIEKGANDKREKQVCA